MIDLELPLELSAESPAFASANGARAWLAQLPLTNAQRAQAVLAHQMQLLIGKSLVIEDRLGIVEVLRESVLFLQQESQRRCAGRPLPLLAAERASYEASLDLWRALETNYLLCLQQGIAEQRTDLVALAAQRALAAKTGELLAHAVGGFVVSGSFWCRLHQIYRAAESAQVTLRTVVDTARQNPATTVATAYVEPLLLAAAQPLELSHRQIELVANWAWRWAAKVSVLTSLPRDARTPPLPVDLSGAAALAPADGAEAGSDTRWLEVSDLRKSLKLRLRALEQGETPEILQLGSDCAPAAGAELLQRVYRLWCRHGADPVQVLRPETSCELVSGATAIYFCISGSAFSQPDPGSRMSKREIEEIATFGGIIERHREADGRQMAPELWRSRAVGASELQLRRSLEQAGARLCRSQLVAIRVAEQDDFMLAVVRVLAVDAQVASLDASLRLLPGTPSAVALRCTGLGPGADSFVPGFRLPGLEHLREPASVLMPSTYFRPGRIIEILSDRLRQIRLTQLLERGSDFERAAFDWE